MNSARHLYSLEVGVPTPSWQDVDPVIHVPPGQAVPIAPRRFHRSLSRADSDDLLKPVVTGLPKGSSFVRDEGELALRVRQGRALLGDLLVSRHPWAHLEAAQAKKIVLQRGGPPGWFLVAGGLVRESAPSLAPGFRAWANLFARLEPPPPELSPPRYKMGTSHGWPDALTTDTSFLMHAFWAGAAGTDFSALSALGARLASILQDVPTPLCALMGNRTGALGKTVAGYSRSEQGIVEDAALTGLCCRRRRVFMMPSAGNMVQLRGALELKHRASQVPWCVHPGGAPAVADKVRRVHRPGWVWFSDDISGYDESVSHTHQRELADLLIAPSAGRAFAQYKLSWKDIPMLGPGIRPSEEAFLYEKRGMTPSGDLLTAFDGTWINAARILMCVAAASGRTVERAMASLGRDWAFFCQGDDTVLGFQKGLISLERYEEVSAEYGYRTKVEEGVVFLMHLIDPDSGAWTPLASRVFQQTVFNEYPGRDSVIELMAWVARTPPQFWAVNPWAHTIDRALQRAHIFQEFGVTPTTAWVALKRPDVNARLVAALRATPKIDERFAAIDPTLLSDAAATLLVRDTTAALPQLSPDECSAAALRLADYLATPLDERPRHPDLGGRAQDYYLHVTGQLPEKDAPDHDDDDDA